MRIGLLGGTFDPPHIGHLWLAETAKEQLDLDCVLFLPVGIPTHKTERQITKTRHRLAMTKLAIASRKNFVLDTNDIDRPPPHSTVTLLPIIQEKYPEAELWLLLGADSLRDFNHWIEPEKIVRQCRIGVLERPGVEIAWPELETAVPNLRATVTLLEGPTVAISSTEIRNWAHAGHSLRFLVDTAVLTYIQTNQIYINSE